MLGMDEYTASLVPINLYKALLAAKLEMPGVEMTKVGQVQTRTYEYADLATTLQTIEPMLFKQSLFLAHYFDGSTLVTALVHAESGERLESRIPVDLDLSPQEIGKLITYLRRYSVHALLSLKTGGDDDAASPQKAAEEKARERQKPDPRKDTPKQDAPAGTEGKWSNQKLGFGKYKDETWLHMSEGEKSGGRYSYLEWVRDKGEKVGQASRERAAQVIGMIDKRWIEQQTEAEKLPPVGEGVESVF